MKIFSSQSWVKLCTSMILCVVGAVAMLSFHPLDAMDQARDLKELPSQEAEQRLTRLRERMRRRYRPSYMLFLNGLLPDIFGTIVAYLTRLEEISDRYICTASPEGIWQSMCDLQRLCDQTISLMLLNACLTDEGKSLGDLKVDGTRKRTILHFACSNDLPPDIIIAAGGDKLWELLSARDEQGDSPLCLAVACGDCKFVAMLIQAADSCGKAGELIMMAGASGDGPLHLATQAGHLEIVRVLLGAAQRCRMLPAFLAMQSIDKRTALHGAAEYGRDDVIDELCQAANACDMLGYFLSMRNNVGEMALHRAVAYRENLDAVTALLKWAAACGDIEGFLVLQDDRGYTALDRAKKAGDPEIIKILKNVKKLHRANSSERCSIQ